MKRENGYYWVKKADQWFVCEWDNDHFYFGIYELRDSAFQEINENKLIPPTT